MKEISDPLRDKKFKRTGIADKLREIFLGYEKPLDCVQVEVTSFCSGACVYCPHTTQADHWKSRHMRADVFASLWPLLRQSGRAHLQGWGEPLLHPRFFDFAEFALNAGCQVSTTSCGIKMDENTAARLAESGMDLIAFSLAGTDSVSNDARKKVPFDVVCESIKKLRKAVGAVKHSRPLEIHLAYLLLADRMEAVATLPELMDRLDVEMAVVSTLDYLALPEQAALAFAPGETEKIAKAQSLLRQAAREAEKRGRLIFYALPGPTVPEGGCRENIARSLYVDAAGNLSPCVYLNLPGNAGTGVTFGSSLEKNPLAIWNSPEFVSFRQNLLDNRPNGHCVHCPKRLEVAGE